MEQQVQAGGIKEIAWKEVKGYEGLYLVSEHGEVYSYFSKKILKHSVRDGYHGICLCNNGKYYRPGVHRLVALNFIPNPNNLPVINHIDGDKSNNHYSNLEWCTVLHNNIHAYITGLKVLPKGVNDKRSVPIIQMDLSGNFIREWAGAREAQRLGGFRQSNIWHCLKGNQHKSQGFKWAYK